MEIKNTHTTTNKTLRLMQGIGTPWTVTGNSYPIEESRELFEHAFKNRVGLFYLESLKSKGKLNHLENEWEDLIDREKETHITAVRASNLLNEIDVPYIVFMSFYPFPATPNDVEFIILGSDDDYKKTIEKLSSKGYKILNEGPDTILFGDPRGGKAINPRKKGGRYYVDIGRSVSLDYFQFLDLKKAKKSITTYRDKFGNSFPCLEQPLELATSIIHSVLEQRLGLEIIYFLYYFLLSQESEGIKVFKEIAREHSMKNAIAPVLSIAARLHKDAFGFIPEQLNYAMKIIGSLQSEAKHLLRKSYQMQYKFRFSTFLFALLGKLSESNARISFYTQLYRMLNPGFLIEVVQSLWKRRTSAETHMQN